jgi:hypothetical protein
MMREGGSIQSNFQVYAPSGQDISPTYVFRISASEVPEPATSFMMLMGFGAIGATIRRRKTKVAVTYA